MSDQSNQQPASNSDGLTAAPTPQIFAIEATLLRALIDLLQVELPMCKARGFVEALERLPIMNVVPAETKDD